MRQRGRMLLAGFALLAASFLAGCNGEDKGGAGQGAAAQGSAARDPAKAVDVAKSNAYVMAANVSSGAFSKALTRYQETIVPKLAGDRPLKDFSVVPVHEITQIRTRLQSAIALEGSVPEIDQAARDYAAAIVAFEPVNNNLSNYAESKGFLTDGGAKARQENAAFLASLSEVAEAETAFFDKIGERDERLLRQAFEAAPEGSVERFRAGIVLQAKSAMKQAPTVFTDPADVTTRKEFGQKLEEMASMVEGWDRAVRAEKPEGCPILQMKFNQVIAAGRQAVQAAEQGRFDLEGGSSNYMIQNQFSSMQSSFGGMINELNHPFSC